MQERIVMLVRVRQRWLWPVLAGAIVAGCGGPPSMTAGQMNASYEQALVQTAAVSVENPSGDDGARQALGRAEGFFTGMQADTVLTRAAATYAPEAYLNDNIAVVQSSAAIGQYFARTLERTRSIDVDFLDVTHNGIDYFVRWRMTVASDRLNNGAPMVSYGMTHFRFDEQGRILLHKDFWDAGTGLYEYLPVLGPVLRQVRARAEGD